jgi:hypothetical protein
MTLNGAPYWPYRDANQGLKSTFGGFLSQVDIEKAAQSCGGAGTQVCKNSSAANYLALIFTELISILVAMSLQGSSVGWLRPAGLLREAS